MKATIMPREKAADQFTASDMSRLRLYRRTDADDVYFLVTHFGCRQLTTRIVGTTMGIEFSSSGANSMTYSHDDYSHCWVEAHDVAIKLEF